MNFHVRIINLLQTSLTVTRLLLFEMSTSELNYIPTRTTKFFYKMNIFFSICGLPNLWIVNVYNKRIYKYFHSVITFLLFVFIFMEIGAFFTQPCLSDKQSTDRLLFSFSHPILLTYYIGMEYHKTKVKDLFIKLCITMKNIYNDLDVETHMIRKASLYSIAYILTVSVSLISYGFDGLMQVIRSGGSFTTVVIAWPEVSDNSALGNLVRVISYLVWWAFMTRVSAVLILTIVATVALSHQYKNLQSYFYSLNDFFQNVADENDHKENELKYIEALKVGIKLHSDTLWCTRQCQETCSLVFSGQIIINVSVFCLLMLQMVNSERTLTNAMTIICTSVALLTSTGFLMWNAGDITVEKHVVIQSFGVVEVSYQSYLSIVKSSYSAFSLLY